MTAIESVDLALQPGEILGIVGESGSGKSVTAACYNAGGANMVTSHAYTVDHVVDNGDGTFSVVVRNPWGVDGYSSNDNANNTMNVDENLTTTDMNATDMNAVDMNATDMNAMNAADTANAAADTANAAANNADAAANNAM